MSGAVEGVALLPCPFCGGDAFIRHVEAHDHTPMLKALLPQIEPAEDTYWPECGCGAVTDGCNSQSEAIAAWNTRTTPPARSYADGVEDAAKVADDLANAAASLQAALELHGVDAPVKNAQRETATTLAAAIRILSQEPQP